MYPSERNRFPNLRGQSFRVENRGYSTPNEVSYVRGQTISACQRSGTLYVHWRRFSPDWNNGQCPRCVDGDLYESGGNSIDPNCKVCYGSGWTGGFSPPVVQWMIVNDQDSTLTQTELGVIRLSNQANSYSPYIPQINNSDLLGRLVYNDGAYEVQERYHVTGKIKPERLLRSLKLTTRQPSDHLQQDSDISGYSFEAATIPPYGVEYKVPFEDAVWLANPGEDPNYRTEESLR